MTAAVLLLGALTAACACFGAPIPEVFTFDSPEAAQKAWVGSNAPTVADDPEVGRCLVLEAPFGQGAKGASWDHAIPLDLTQCDFVSFLANLSDSGAVGNMGFYFKSGDGWYAAFRWMSYAGWSKVSLPRSGFGTEGTPAGWDKISGIRIAFWPAPGRQRDVTAKLGRFRADTRGEVGNVLWNTSFEIATTGDIPDCWGSGHWGIRDEPWVLDMGLWRRMWRRDEVEAYDGQYCMRVENAPGLPQLALYSGWAALDDAAKPSTLSAYLRADRDGLPVKVSFGECAREVRVGRRWERFSVTGASGGEAARVLCVFQAQADGVLWVDAVQLELSDKATPYAGNESDIGLAEAARRAPMGAAPRARSRLASVRRATLGASPVRIDEHGRYLRGGTPFIPYALGLEALPTDGFLRDIAAAGFNAVCVQTYKENTLNQISHVWDRCAELGIAMIPWVDSRVSNEQLREWVTALKDHPACLAWYVLDEPGTADKTPLLERLRVAHEADPGRPAYINYVGDYAADFPGDIASLDRYPIPWSDPATIAAATQSMADATRGSRKPIWIWLQDTGFAYFLAREPTPLEEDCMVYLSLIHGARGILYFAHKPRSAPLWNEMRHLAREVEELTPVLSDTRGGPKAQVSDARIHLCTKRHEGKVYIVAMNSTPERVEAAFEGDGVRGRSTADVWFEARSVEVREGRLTDGFGPFERHVYELR